MIAVNHVATGVLIGTIVTNPYLAGVLAVASHFVLDALPQFGFTDKDERNRLRRPIFRIVLILDVIAVVSLLTYVLFAADRLDLFIIGLLGYSPDLLWIENFVTHELARKRPSSKIKLNPLSRFHAKIQTFEYPWGIWLEIPLLGLLLYLIFPL